MARKSDGKKTRRQTPEARKFYIISDALRERQPDFEIENLDVLRGRASILQPPRGKRGFPAYPEKPRVVIGKVKQGRRATSDIEPFHMYWLISDRLKSVFEEVDPSAFAFQACDVRLQDGSAGPDYWLCDVVRMRNAFSGKTLRDIREYRKKTGLFGLLTYSKELVFDEAKIGESHIFRTSISWNNVFCDQVMKDACEEQTIKGIKFFKSFK